MLSNGSNWLHVTVQEIAWLDVEPEKITTQFADAISVTRSITTFYYCV